MTMQIGRYPSESSHEGKTIWQMYIRHQQVDQLLEEKHCGGCRYFEQKQKDMFVHPGFRARHYRCALFNSEFRTAKNWTEVGDGSTDWDYDWLACGAFWAHEGEPGAEAER